MSDGRPAEREPGASAPRRHYGWVIVATLSVTETITWGIIFYGFPVFLRAMEGELGASRVVVTGAFSSSASSSSSSVAGSIATARGS